MVRTVPRQNVTPVKRGRPRKLNPLSGDYETDTMYDESTIDAIDEDIQALHQLEVGLHLPATKNSFGHS